MKFKVFEVRPLQRQNSDSPSRSGDMVEVTTNGENLPASLATTHNWQERWCTMPAIFANRFQEIYDFTLKDDDVFVITFPKSGSTWLQEAIWLLTHELNYEAAKSEHIRKRSIFLEYSGMNDKLPNDSIEAANNLKSPRILKTHLPPHLLPREIWQRKTKIVYCARNLKDVVVSYFTFLCGLGYWSGKIDDFVNDFMNNELMHTPYWDTVLDFWQLREQPNVFFTTYEQLKADLPKVLRAICEFLERPALTEAEMTTLVDHLSFDKMKTNPCANPTLGVTKVIKESSVALPEFEFMRRGIVGGYKDELSIENQQRLDEWSQQFLQDRQVKLSDIWKDTKYDM